jgi:hypothetical protein
MLQIPLTSVYASYHYFLSAVFGVASKWPMGSKVTLQKQQTKNNDTMHKQKLVVFVTC